MVFCRILHLFSNIRIPQTLANMKSNIINVTVHWIITKLILAYLTLELKSGDVSFSVIRASETKFGVPIRLRIKKQSICRLKYFNFFEHVVLRFSVLFFSTFSCCQDKFYCQFSRVSSKKSYL